ncbi:MAG: hypothetical protein ABII27_00850 [bacterium]
MGQENSARDRLSIDVNPQEHRKIKAYAALHGQSIREYVIDSIRERLRQEEESKQLSALTEQPTSVLQELWDNEKDSAYDEL